MSGKDIDAYLPRGLGGEGPKESKTILPRKQVSTSPPGSRFESIKDKGQVASVLFWVTGCLAAVAAVVTILQLVYLGDILGGGTYTEQGAAAVDARQETVSIVHLLLWVICAILFLRWIHRARTNLGAMGAAGLKYSPAWSVWSFFVPILNVYRPFQVVREIWKASEPVDRGDNTWMMIPTPPIIKWWWGFYVAAVMSGQVSSNLLRSENAGVAGLQDISLGLLILLLSNVVEIPAAIAASRIVKRISQAQSEKARLLGLEEAS